ncbi:nicotinate (nicotinamide) nucleotide adenylyltransferase [Acholeplasma hippikon]|nr:nicotinate (nicotinamide) nucleotide adenylyltransferase [Acholeplasma hippikon]
MILVYGGSFNPPTKAHLEIINLLNEKLNPEKIIILPVGNKYTWKNNLISFEKRFDMLHLLTNEVRNVIVSDLENTTTFTGTYDALNKISEIYETKDIYFVFGTDHLETLRQWINYEALLKTYGFVIIKRKNYEIDLSIFKEYNTKHEVISYDSEVSSTKVRENLEKFKSYITKEVYEYIVANDLYKGENL